MEIKRVWAMPNKWTFKIKPIQELLKKYHTNSGWIDPFAGMYSPAEITNDLNPKAKAQYHMEAIDFISMLEGEYRGILFDPPYSLTQVERSYKNIGLPYFNDRDRTGGFKKVKDVASDLIKPCGYAISCGWNSNGFGINRGFKIIEILLIAHGGNHHDTIVTVERRLSKEQLSFF